MEDADRRQLIVASVHDVVGDEPRRAGCDRHEALLHASRQFGGCVVGVWYCRMLATMMLPLSMFHSG